MKHCAKNEAEKLHQLSHRSWSVVIFFCIIFFLLTNPSCIPRLFAQTGTWSLGKYEFLQAPSSGPLLKNMRGRSSLVAYSFVGGVGGVSFGAIAEPIEKVEIWEGQIEIEHPNK